MIWHPTLSDVFRFHNKIIERTGGAHGVLQRSLIESAILRGETSFGGHEAYPTVEQKVAAIVCGLIQNHGFVDGNKRIGIAILLLMMNQNDVRLCYTQQELVSLGLDIARGIMDVDETAKWLIAHKV